MSVRETLQGLASAKYILEVEVNVIQAKYPDLTPQDYLALQNLAGQGVSLQKESDKLEE
eukprot:Awhi_evm1s9660